MKPEEFLEIINNLPADQRAAYEHDLLLYGRGYVEMIDGRYRRIAPKDILIEQIPRKNKFVKKKCR